MPSLHLISAPHFLRRRLQHQRCDRQRGVSLCRGSGQGRQARIIDVHGAFDDQDAPIPDRIHPDSEGMTEIAKAVHRGLAGKMLATN